MKKIIAIIISVIMVISLCACNRTGIFVDLNNQANWAEVRHFNGEIYIYKVVSWSQDEEGYTINTDNGDTLYVNGVNCIMSKQRPNSSLGKFVE